VTIESKSERQLVRVAANLAIGIVGLVAVRFIVQALPMFHDAGWIVQDKLSVMAGAVIVVDAMLLSVLVRFAIELRAYLLGRFAQIRGVGNIAASLVFLITAAIAYMDFTPVTTAWPSTQQPYLWTSFAIAAALLLQIVVLLFRDRDLMAALVLRQPLPAAPTTDEPSEAGEARAASAGR
jgi:hypothetical protein